MPWGTSFTIPAPPFGASGLRKEGEVFTYKHVFAITEQSYGSEKGAHVYSSPGQQDTASPSPAPPTACGVPDELLEAPGKPCRVLRDTLFLLLAFKTQNRIYPGPVQPLLPLHRERAGPCKLWGLPWLGQTGLRERADSTKRKKHSAQCFLFYPFSSKSAPLPLN